VTIRGTKLSWSDIRGVDIRRGYLRVSTGVSHRDAAVSGVANVLVCLALIAETCTDPRSETLQGETMPRARGNLVRVGNRHVNVSFDEAGLHFEGQDLGGTDEYEFFYEVPVSSLAEFADLAGVDAADPVVGLTTRYKGDDRWMELEVLLRQTKGVTFSNWF
jgi:hypothetical protein